MSLYTPDDQLLDIPGYGGGGRGGGTGGGGGVFRMPGRASQVPFTRFPRPVKLPPPKFPKVELPKWQPPQIPKPNWKIPNLVIPSFPPNNPNKIPKDENKKTNQNKEVRLPEQNDQQTNRPKDWDDYNFDPPKDPYSPTYGFFQEMQGFQGVPGNWYDFSYRVQETGSWHFGVLFGGLGSRYNSPPSYSYSFEFKAKLKAPILGFGLDVVSFPNGTAGTYYVLAMGYNGMNATAPAVWGYQYYASSNLPQKIPFATYWKPNYGTGYPPTRGDEVRSWDSGTIQSPSAIYVQIPFIHPKPWINDTPVKLEEEEMPCERCRAEEVIWYIRSLKQTISHKDCNIIPLPTGNLLTVDTVAVKTVFALPGTQQAIVEQFNLMAEIKKRLAKTFNQSRMAKVLAKLQQIMSVTDFVLNLHNALMLSEDIVTTFFGTLGSAFDTIAKVVDDTPFIGELFDLGEKPINSAEWFGNAFEERMKEIFGAQNWADLKVKWAAFNNIVRGAAMQIQAARDIGEAQKDLSEMTASRLGKLHNKLAKAGVLFDGDLWEEKVNRRWAWMYKLENMAEDNTITNAAQFVQGWGSQVLDIREQKKEMEESREKFQTDLKADLEKITQEKQTTIKDSTGRPYERSDASPPITNEPE